MPGVRVALIVANDEYDDPGLRRLEAPQHDADALAEVLGDPGVGAFDVTVLHNETAQNIRAAIEDFFVDRKPDDLLLLHFSCHGVKNADGELFLAARDTLPNRLASTGLPADFVNRMMTSSRSQRIALFLDCCYGGAFPRGMLVRAAGEAQVKDAFAEQEEIGGGRGRVVVTASNAMQYSFEAGELSEDSVRPSVFTGALVDALSTGEADKDADGWIGMNELFSFVSDKVKEISPNQTPQMWTFGAQGDMYVARSRIRRVKATPLEPQLAEAMANPLPAARYGLVDLFRERLASNDLGVALAAHQALSSMLGDDSRRLADSASAALESCALTVDPHELDLHAGEDGKATGVLVLHGPPLASTITAKASEPWIRIEHDDPRLRIIATGPAEPGTTYGTVTLTSPVAEHEVLVRVTSGVGAAPAPVVVAPEPEPEPVAATKAASVAPPQRERVPTQTTGEPPNRRPLMIGAAAAAVVAALVVGFLLTRGGGDDGTPSAKPDDTKSSDTTPSPGPTADLPKSDPFPEPTLVWATHLNGSAIKYILPNGNVRTLPTAPAEAALWPSLTPDRRTLIYQTVPAENIDDPSDTALHVIAPDGTGDRILLKGAPFCENPGRPSIGSHGLIVLACFDEEGERVPGIRVINLNGELVRTLDEDGLGGSPRWTPDNSAVIYWRLTGEAFGDSEAQNLYAVPADGSGSPVQLTDGVVKDLFPTPSPDGKALVFGRVDAPGHDSDLWIAPLTVKDGEVSIGEPERMVASQAGRAEFDAGFNGKGHLLYSADGELMLIEELTVDAAALRLFPDDPNMYMPLPID